MEIFALRGSSDAYPPGHLFLQYRLSLRFKYDIEPIIRYLVIVVLINSTVRYGIDTGYLLRMRIILQYKGLMHGVKDHEIF